MDKLNLGDTLREINPLIYTAISGFGKEGPLGSALHGHIIKRWASGRAVKESRHSFALICDKITAYTAC